MIDTLSDAGIEVTDFKENGFHYFIGGKDDRLHTLGVYGAGQRREWHLMTVLALRYFHIKHPYTE